MRAISTVFDVSLCLLLISASAFVLVGVKPPDSSMRTRTAESTANVLTTSTAGVNYTIPTDTGTLHRTTHGSLAGLLGEAVLANTTIRGGELSHTTDPFERRVARRVRERLDHPASVQLLVRWMPYRDSHLEGQFVVGESPPPRMDVHAAIVSLPSGFPPVRERAIDAARHDGYRGVASVVAAAVVAGMVPERTTRLALSDRETSSAVGLRLRRLAHLYGVDVSNTHLLASERTRASLVDAVTNAIEADLRETFETPTDAARSVSVGKTRLVVRMWDA
ncbi:hypothetical protein [Haladaptatus sp. CMAA 1911]|uniref:DUF7284 family protein n=1 Tax=unclassified Haladaptatus TaxID=2622732 RepID=UPI0037542C4D